MDTGAQHGIIGDNFGTDLPETEVQKQALDEEKVRAKFSRTAEFKKQKEYIESRIKFYQHMLPNGAEVGLEVQPTAEDWRVANRVIGEFLGFLSLYENAGEAVANAGKQL